MGSPIQYAQLPQYSYQSFDDNLQFRYQTFDRYTAQFSYHPVSADNLTANNQDNKPDAPEAEKDQAPAPDAPQKDKSSSENASSPEAEGMPPNIQLSV